MIINPTYLATLRATRASMRRLLPLAACILVGLAATTASAQTTPTAGEPAVVDVQWGDTFSSIAGRYTGNIRTWRQMYNPQMSGLPNPDRINVGMRFELVTEPSGARYLRLAGSTAPLARASVAKPAAAMASASVPAPTPVVPPTPAAPAVAAVAAAPSAASTGPANPDNMLVIGVLPNIGAQQLLAQYDNLKRYLERLGPQKVRIVLPSSFKTFFDGTMRGEFDLAVAAPHFARVAQLERGMVPIAMYEPRINALFVAPIDSKVAAASDLRDKPVALANPTSLVALYGLQWLQQQKLEPGKDVEVKAGRSDMGVGRMMLSGEAAAAIMSNGEMRALPAEEAARIKVVDVIARIPNFIILANPRLPRERIAQLKAQMKDFLMNHEEGLAFGRATGFTGIVDADDVVLRELDPFTAATRRIMGYGG